jgi:hypothetical protein
MNELTSGKTRLRKERSKKQKEWGPAGAFLGEIKEAFYL